MQTRENRPRHQINDKMFSATFFKGLVCFIDDSTSLYFQFLFLRSSHFFFFYFRICLKEILFEMIINHCEERRYSEYANFRFNGKFVGSIELKLIFLS